MVEVSQEHEYRSPRRFNVIGELRHLRHWRLEIFEFNSNSERLANASTDMERQSNVFELLENKLVWTHVSGIDPMAMDAFVSLETNFLDNRLGLHFEPGGQFAKRSVLVKHQRRRIHGFHHGNDGFALTSCRKTAPQSQHDPRTPM